MWVHCGTGGEGCGLDLCTRMAVMVLLYALCEWMFLDQIVLLGRLNNLNSDQPFL